MAGEIDLNADDIRAKLLMSATTADTQNDGLVNVDDITTLDVSDATGYADVALGTETVTKIDATDRAKFSSDSVSGLVFSGLSTPATSNYVGILLYKYVSGLDSADLVIAFIEFTTPIAKEATQVTVPCPADGWFYLS